MSREEFERKKNQVDGKIPKGYFSPRKSREKINEKIKRKKTRKKPFLANFLDSVHSFFLESLEFLLTYFLFSFPHKFSRQGSLCGGVQDA